MDLPGALLIAVSALAGAVVFLFRLHLKNASGISLAVSKAVAACTEEKRMSSERHMREREALIAAYDQRTEALIRRHDEAVSDLVTRVRSLEDSRSTELKDLAIKVTTTLAHNAQALADLTSAIRTGAVRRCNPSSDGHPRFGDDCDGSHQ